MRAEGNVFLSNGGETAEGAWAEYDVAGGMMRMGGQVVLTQGENAIAGDELVINMTEGTGPDRGPRGRPRQERVYPLRQTVGQLSGHERAAPRRAGPSGRRASARAIAAGRWCAMSRCR